MKTITTNRGKNNTAPSVSQQKNASLSLTFKNIVQDLQSVENGKLRLQIIRQIQKLASEEKGKLFVKCLPFMALKTGSYREVGEATGISYTQIRKWVEEYAPELFSARSRGGELS